MSHPYANVAVVGLPAPLWSALIYCPKFSPMHAHTFWQDVLDTVLSVSVTLLQLGEVVAASSMPGEVRAPGSELPLAVDVCDLRAELTNLCSSPSFCSIAVSSKVENKDVPCMKPTMIVAPS